ncbi:hypothetical protein [Corynebacterium cystitidis]|uniref:hypothetical protein n=1 Tax=Corynebacterium cystitidis TaxID=35757 RepID=UPI00211DFBCC|nr:hypothetical protein [Corynebacterium cystitidis]
MSDLDSLGRSLWWLERRGHELDDLLVPRVPSSGENAGKAAVRGRSKPPLNVGIADLKIEAEATVGYWCGQVVAACPRLGPVPVSRALAVRAAWLFGVLPELVDVPWIGMMAEEIVGLVMTVEEVVCPNDRRDDPDPPEEGTSRVMSRWAKFLGSPVSRSMIVRAVEEGRLDYRTDGQGQRLVRLDDVLALSRNL